ncbi:MAG: protein translocase subunit SecF [Proteobacteria bacterium]|jgi:preprotein translocase subunit SecF|nr:protein translocase subunit SecF [Pseudomonadota bacterium]
MNFYDKTYNFLKYKTFFISISLILFLSSVFFFAFKGLNYGVDFKGGTVIEMKFDNTFSSDRLRNSLNKLNLGDVKVKEFGSNIEFLATIEKKGDNNFISTIKNHLEKDLSQTINFRRVEVVGSKISEELTKAGIYSVVIALLLMLFYIWVRFEWQFSLGAIIALVHDVIITIGAFSVVGYEFGLSIVAAVLTIVGYSMNDTVVIYDRIREYLKKDDQKDLQELINESLNSTLSRTLKTSLTTLLALVSIYFFGGEILKGFSFALIWGVLIGTYSSIFVAAPVLIYFNVKRDWSEKVDNTP